MHNYFRHSYIHRHSCMHERMNLGMHSHVYKNAEHNCACLKLNWYKHIVHVRRDFPQAKLTGNIFDHKVYVGWTCLPQNFVKIRPPWAVNQDKLILLVSSNIFLSQNYFFIFSDSLMICRSSRKATAKASLSSFFQMRDLTLWTWCSTNFFRG